MLWSLGNSSQTSDGAAAVILARRAYARKNNLPVIGVFRSYAVVGVPPEIMGIGPAYAIPEALSRIGRNLFLVRGQVVNMISTV